VGIAVASTPGGNEKAEGTKAEGRKRNLITLSAFGLRAFGLLSFRPAPTTAPPRSSIISTRSAMVDRRHAIVWIGLLGGAAAVWLAARPTAGLAQEQAPARKSVSVTARKYAFSPSRIEVRQGDIVQVTLDATDIAHSFTVDEYRIAKRAAPGQPVTFEFRADRPGTFRFYCNLKQDDGCRNMQGELVVR
jgi:cytochrome c oxidase subunit 2